jgi:UDP-N-acetylmuramate dehydrogenase
VGGAVVGNAGAFDGDIASVLCRAKVLESSGEVVERHNEWFEFDYRLSRIKREGPGQRSVVLAATFELQRTAPEPLAARMSEILEWRRTRHPSGATMGSTFKNPPDSHAGYLIEQAGLRGSFIGGAQISEMHGNFFMNTGDATAEDVLALIKYARGEVKRQFDVDMELEIELVGEW